MFLDDFFAEADFPVDFAEVGDLVDTGALFVGVCELEGGWGRCGESADNVRPPDDDICVVGESVTVIINQS